MKLVLDCNSLIFQHIMFKHIVDQRYYQIAILSILLIYGCFVLKFDIDITHIVIIITTALCTQLLCSKIVGIAFDYRSALITSLSISILLRTEFLYIAMFAVVIAIISKFIIRWNGRHIFNPANIGIIAMVLFTDLAWISPAQWGNTALLAFLLACTGMFIIYKSLTLDVTISFLASYILLIFGRAVYLGDPMSIALHQLQNGGLLLFAFFMISDPKTTPNARHARIIYAIMVAVLAFYVQYFLYMSQGLLYSLIIMSLFVPIFDRLIKGERFQWLNHSNVKL